MPHLVLIVIFLVLAADVAVEVVYEGEILRAALPAFRSWCRCHDAMLPLRWEFVKPCKRLGGRAALLATLALAWRLERTARHRLIDAFEDRLPVRVFVCLEPRLAVDEAP